MNSFKAGYLVLVVLLSGLSYGQVDSSTVQAEHQQVEKAFETRVAKMASFFETKQKLVYYFEHPKSKSGRAAHVVEYTCKKINYTVSSTGSTGITHVGHISLSLSKRTNRACGKVPDVTILAPPAGWETVAEALQNNREPCFKTTMQTVIFPVRLDFNYSDGRWQFLGAVNENSGEPESALSAALGMIAPPALPIEEPAALQMNARWKALVE